MGKSTGIPISPTEHKEYGFDSRVSASSSPVSSQPYSEHGPGIDIELPHHKFTEAEPDLWWSHVRHQLREPFSEFFGVFVIILFGDGVVAQVVLSDGAKGDYQSISWGWGSVELLLPQIPILHCRSTKHEF